MTINTHEMVIVHRAFRREFRLLPKMVIAVPPDDTRQRAVVSEHAREMVSILHHHHQGEDELLWPKLHERTPLEAELLTRMKAQHVELSALLDRVGEILLGWNTGTGSAGLAGLLDAVSAQLDAHLSEEEERLLPIAAAHLTQEEWDELGQRGMASMPKSRSLVFLGHILEEASPEEAAGFLRHIPPPVRLLFRTVGRPKYEREIARQRSGLELVDR